jgi:hypothetical protein
VNIGSCFKEHNHDNNVGIIKTLGTHHTNQTKFK